MKHSMTVPNYQCKIAKHPTDCKLEIMEFRDVTFGYSVDKPILKEVNLKLLKGKTYALVGPTGGGKSTTASLMARLYDPQQGTVEFLDKDIRKYDRATLASDIGFILQDPFLFSGSVADNIRYGNPDLEDILDDQLYKILEDKGLHELLESFEDGLQTKVNQNSSNISIGQKQLVAFVRAVLRKPKLLILDEATANIDTVTEQLLTKIVDELPRETTKVIIAHRLNTIRNADEIIFINQGRAEKAVQFDEIAEKLGVGRAS